MERKKILMMVLLIGISFSCKKFIQIGAPKDSLVPASIFKSNDLATSAVIGIYERMASSSYASGDANSISTICALTGDEFIGYGSTYQPIFDNQITPSNTTVATRWSDIYQRIYNINAIIEGLKSSEHVTPQIKRQLIGEILFARAFNYFYLVNLYGAIPIYLSTDYEANSHSWRTPITEIYSQIIKDLKESEGLITDSYVTDGRVRPNKSTVYALLARTYLYLKDWENSEKYASLLIRNKEYNLVDLDQVFLSKSTEAIWQLMPTAGGNTPAGALLILTTDPTRVSLRQDFVEQAFELNDQRKNSWIRSLVRGQSVYYYPYKYKVQSSTNLTECIMVFRLAEQYLIRSEARAMQYNLSGAIDDLDAIRKRAKLPLIKNIDPDISKANLLTAIQNERKIELFSEWGDRWFDLKRTGRLNEVLEPLKPNWKAEYALFPIPKIETDRNNNILQNQGY